MDTREVIKSLITSAHDFEKNQNKDSLIQSLQILSAIDDLSVFDNGRFETAEFYILLHDLLSHHYIDSDLVWNIVSVLQVVVRSPKACSALLHTYHFIHPLTTLLDAQLTSEKKLVVLRIIQELSYGVLICWQEAHLPKLIGILLDIITGDDNELISVALGVLVNLCHKNKPAVYILMTCVDIKTFLRIILNLQRENHETGVQVCKMLMVLNHLTGNAPDAEMLSFVGVSFLRITKAFNCGNAFLMRHIVEFFRDAKESEQGRKVLLSYPMYQEQTTNLINLVLPSSVKEVPNYWQCVQQLVEFMQQLVDLELLVIMPLFTQLSECILPWVQVSGVTSSVLELLSSMLHQCRHKDELVYNSLCSSIQNHLQIFIKMLHNGCRTESRGNEVLSSIKSLFHLFRQLLANCSLSTVIANTVDKEELKKLLLPLMCLSNHDESHLFQQPVTALYVEVLSFIHDLSLDDKEWLFLYSDLLQKKPILKALAVALYSGSCQVKKEILYLAGTASFSKECLTMLSKCLTDLNQVFLFAPSEASHCPDKSVPCSLSQSDFSPPLIKIHRDGLDSLIEKLDDLYKKNQIQNASLSGIIELYSYKLAEMQRAEKSLQSSLVAADNHHTQLSHRVAQLCAETGRLHRQLYSSQQTFEGSQMELVELRDKLHTVQETANSSHIKFKQLKQDVQSKSMIIKNQSEEILKMRQNIEELIRQLEELEHKNRSLTETRDDQNRLIQKLEQKTESLEEKIEELNSSIKMLEAEKSDLQTVQAKLEEKLRIRDQLILEKEVLVENKTTKVQSLEQEIGNQQGRIRHLEKNVKEKEKELSDQKIQLVDLERMRKIIFEITGGKKSNV